MNAVRETLKLSAVFDLWPGQEKPKVNGKLKPKTNLYILSLFFCKKTIFSLIRDDTVLTQLKNPQETETLDKRMANLSKYYYFI